MNTDSQLCCQPFRWEGPAVADRLGDVRRAVQDWAASVGLPVDLIDDLAIASYEAMANAAEHAYAGVPPGMLSVLVSVSPGWLEAVVTDQGKWREPDTDGGYRGRGLVVIRGIATDTTVTTAEQGTTVRMRWQRG